MDSDSDGEAPTAKAPTAKASRPRHAAQETVELIEGVEVCSDETQPEQGFGALETLRSVLNWRHPSELLGALSPPLEHGAKPQKPRLALILMLGACLVLPLVVGLIFRLSGGSFLVLF